MVKFLLTSFLLVITITFPLATRAIADVCPTVSRPTCQCGDTVSGTYSVPANLTCSSGNGLKVASNSVLDCALRDITGSFSSSGNTNHYGIRIENADNVTVRRCNVSDFYRGVYVTDSRDVRIEDISSFDNGQYGIDITDTFDVSAYSQRVTVVGSDVTGNADEGIHVSVDVGVVSPPAAGHALIGNSVVENGCEGIYVLRIDGTASNVNGIRIFSNSVFGNDSACPMSGTHAGIYVKDSSYNRIRYNSLTHDYMQLTDSSSNNIVTYNVINHSFLKLDDGSSDNAMSNICVLGDTTTPGDSFQIHSNANNNSCSKCAAYRPSSKHINATGASGNTFTNLRIDTTSPLVEAGSGATWTVSTGPLACLE